MSKAYGAIARFSEDIDVSIHPSALGIDADEDWKSLSQSQKDNRIKKLYKKMKAFVPNQLLPALKAAVSDKLGEDEWKLNASHKEHDRHEVYFHYPKVMPEQDQLSYARPYVLIELSGRAEHVPTEVRSIEPYVAETFPEVIQNASYEVKVLAAVRTFWEKVTILHAESSRPEDQAFPPRLARHAYDLCQLMKSGEGLGEEALTQIDLLKRVCEHKAFFFTQGRVDYEMATNGGLCLIPSQQRLKELQKDYEEMKDYFFKEPPPFEEVIRMLRLIEKRANEA